MLAGHMHSCSHSIQHGAVYVHDVRTLHTINNRSNNQVV
jgi:hypothetical protein